MDDSTDPMDPSGLEDVDRSFDVDADHRGRHLRRRCDADDGCGVDDAIDVVLAYRGDHAGRVGDVTTNELQPR